MTERSIPDSARVELERSNSPDALLAFLTITHGGLTEPIRVVSDVFNYIWAGEEYVGIPFGATPLTDTDQPPATEIRVQNIDRRIGKALEATNERAKVEVVLLSSADFDLTADPRTEIGTPAEIYAFREFEMVDVSVDVMEVTARVMLRDFAQEPFPSVAATQDRLPGLYR